MVSNYYYIIVGGGLAGLQLALKLKKDVFFKGKSIAIIDPSSKTENDKTWCFWEKDGGHWDHLVHKYWDKGEFATPEVSQKIEFSPYRYKMIRSLDFYEYAKAELETSEDIYFIEDEIQDIDPVTRKAKGKEASYSATHFFDSRITSDYLDSNKYTTIFQHFKGWTIRTEKPVFQPSVFTMMDYRIKYQDSTSFTYILPFSANEALVEFTFFTPFLTEEKVYDEKLKEYISKILKLEHYEIDHTESGIIPMTNFPFEADNTTKITKIGTAGGWVKASSGYSFKNTEKMVDRLINNIKSGYYPGKDLINYRFRKYDSIFLDVLARNNELGESIFTDLYIKNEPEAIFRFLDEETSGRAEDLKIMFSLYHKEFVKSFFRNLF